ncbi:sulfurtransferase tusD, partial [Vibrio cholerae HC-57A2]
MRSETTHLHLSRE